MQVSTRSRDFLVDVLALREHMHRINRWTTDRSILKVLHGADYDIKWLQRDFGVYVVGMFDTGQVSRGEAWRGAEVSRWRALAECGGVAWICR